MKTVSKCRSLAAEMKQTADNRNSESVAKECSALTRRIKKAAEGGHYKLVNTYTDHDTTAGVKDYLELNGFTVDVKVDRGEPDQDDDLYQMIVEWHNMSIGGDTK
jgi:hypothetical protein